MSSVVLEQKFDNKQALPYGEEFASRKDKQFLEYLRSPKVASVRHSDGVLYVPSGMYDCKVMGHRWSNTMDKFCLECDETLGD